MSLDPANFIYDLDSSNPVVGDPTSQADDHLRSIKKAITQTFPNGFDAAMNLTQAQMNGFDARITALEGVTLPTLTSPEIGLLQTTASAGTHAVTGVGFQPTVIVVVANVVTTNYMNVSIGAASADYPTGQCLGTLASGSSSRDSSNQYTSALYYAWNGITAQASGTLSSFDADGFTISKTDYLDAANLMWICFK